MGPIPTTEEFIEKARNIHNNYYTYSKCVYKKSQEKVCISCHKHGDFWQTPNDHLKGKGCRKCGYENNSMLQTYSLQKIIKLFRKKHGTKYNYDKCIYTKSKEKICITCLIHGDFWQTADKHLKGRGCPKCGRTSKSSIENFIGKSKTIHNNKYTYDKCIYVNNRTKVCITCPQHGDFWQTPCMHLEGKGCNVCGGSNKLTLDKFINLANYKHNGKFNYSKCIYNGNKKKVCITCPQHGDFWQTPNSHLRGTGCPNCKNSKGENIIIDFLKKHKIHFEKNKCFDGCIYKNKLFFDFFIPTMNLCIEFDGVQHFKPILRFGGIRGFRQNIKRDNIKTKYCKDNNINLLRIKYTDFKNIESILKSRLNAHTV